MTRREWLGTSEARARRENRHVRRPKRKRKERDGQAWLEGRQWGSHIVTAPCTARGRTRTIFLKNNSWALLEMAIQQRKAGLAGNAYCRLNNNPPTCMTHVLISVSKLRQVTRALGFKKDFLRLVVSFIVSEKAQKETSLSFVFFNFVYPCWIVKEIEYSTNELRIWELFLVECVMNSHWIPSAMESISKRYLWLDRHNWRKLFS